MHLPTLSLTGFLMLCAILANAQTTNNKLSGVWGMYKDKHPDGWGYFKRPYMYMEFLDGNTFNKIILGKEKNSIGFGTYELVKDSLLVLHESVATDGTHKGLIQADTLRLYSLKSDYLELWEDWDRILWKSTKKWGHKQKYRPATDEERKNLEAVKNRLMADYARIKDNDDQ